MTVIYVMSMADLTSLSIVSYNCRGLNVLKTSYIKSLLSKTTVFFYKNTGYLMANYALLAILIIIFCTQASLVSITQKYYVAGQTVAVQ